MRFAILDYFGFDHSSTLNYHPSHMWPHHILEWMTSCLLNEIFMFTRMWGGGKLQVATRNIQGVSKKSEFSENQLWQI